MGEYHGFHSCRMPNIRFGNFDREIAIFEILEEMSRFPRWIWPQKYPVNMDMT